MNKSFGQVGQTPAIVTMVTLHVGKGGPAVDVVTFADGRVLVICKDGIELWPSETAMLATESQGDFPEMMGFIEYEAGLPSISTQRSTHRVTTRFGRVTQVGLRGVFIESFEGNTIYLRDGCYLRLRPEDISLWSDDVDERMGLLGMMTWEVE